MLYIDSGRSSDKNTSNINPSDDAVELDETLPQSVRELHRPEDKRTAAGHTMPQEPPLERLDMEPFGVLCIEEEAFFMVENVRNHQADEPKEKILRAQPRHAWP